MLFEPICLFFIFRHALCSDPFPSGGAPSQFLFVVKLFETVSRLRADHVTFYEFRKHLVYIGRMLGRRPRALINRSIQGGSRILHWEKNSLDERRNANQEHQSTDNGSPTPPFVFRIFRHEDWILNKDGWEAIVFLTVRRGRGLAPACRHRGRGRRVPHVKWDVYAVAAC